MKLLEKNGISFFQFPNLAKFSDIRHGIFTRKSGYSRPPFQGLNVGLSLGDNSENVMLNRQAISDCLETKDLVFARQVHQTNVLIFDKHSQKVHSDLHSGDAIVTNIPGKMLAIKTADCQPVLMFDPVRKVVANVHAGWRGSIQNIISHTIDIMKQKFNAVPGDLFAAIGPSLGPCCAEFKNYKTEIPKKIWIYRDSTCYFDFWSISFDQLCEKGVPAKNIHISRLCTSCNTDLFFSYRKEGTTGRFAAVIGLV